MLYRVLSVSLAFVALPAFAQTPLPPSSVATPGAVPPKTYAIVRVTLQTSLGPIILELEKQRAPVTTANFLRYVDQKRFDGMTFYRASKVPGFPDLGFVQGGLGNDPKKVLPPIAHEPTTKTGLLHLDGTISMARLAPGTARGDFVILLGAQPYLDANPGGTGDTLGNAAFGRVVAGMEIIRAIHSGRASPTKGIGPMKGEMLEPTIRVLTARRTK